MRRGRGLALLDLSAQDGQLIALVQLRKGRVPALGAVVGAPAGVEDSLALDAVCESAADKLDARLQPAVGRGNGPEHLRRHEPEQLALARRQVLKLAVRGAHGGNKSMVVGDLGTVADLVSIDGKRRLKAAYARRAEDERLHAVCYSIRDETAVRARVGTQALFVEALRIVQRLLGGVAEDAVRIALERGQVVERVGSLTLFLLGYGCNDALAAGRDHGCLSLASAFESLALGRKISEVQLGGIEGFGNKAGDVCLSLREHGERGRNDAACVQGAVVGDGEQPRGVDADEPVGALTTARGGKEPVIVRAGAKVSKGAAYLAILHRVEPETQRGLGAAREFIEVAEDKFALASGVTGVYDLRDVIIEHEPTQVAKLFSLILWHPVAPVMGQYGQVGYTPST